MKKICTWAAIAVAALVTACSTPLGMNPANTMTLFDGGSIDKWRAVGDANWRVADGAVMADKGSGFLVSKDSYADFHLTAEFWSDADANSGIFIRCSNPSQITAVNAYEVNIFDKRPNPAYGTGAIVNVAAVSPMPWAAGKWNTYEITARGPVFIVSLNGVRTVDGARDSRLASGPVALQYAAGVIKFRNIKVTPL